ncbi:MAG: sensor histidine kinase [Gammaproteobacteria bacterium HGW-Gammaproteobacteria-3]|nr:MAG: sensor histidine kinase [Gammaproteobacteria bacterium HGW-Gammaproteobacteria-3]
MTSIRFYLIAVTLACITLVDFVSAIHGYHSSMAAAEQLFDTQLTEMTKMAATARTAHHKEGLPRPRHDGLTAFQIWREEGVLISHSANAPEAPMAPFVNGFHDRNFGGYRWRVYAHHEQALQEWSFIAERSDVRYELAEKVILESVFPVILGLPLVAIMIGVIVTLGMKHLGQLSGQLCNKAADDLTPITLEKPPKEIRPLLKAINGLLQRLEASFLREKHFAGDAAHELRTPISVLKVQLYNLKTEWPGQLNALKPLEKSIHRMNHLVEQILSLYRTAPDQYMAKFEPLELMALAQSAIAACYHLFDDKQQNIKLVGCTCRLTGDRFALETLLQNLLANANKYSPEASEILVSVNNTPDAVILQIEDSGPGIPEDKYQRVFERFYRLNDDRHKSSAVGCGLGLAIVQHIVELHGASINLGRSCFNSGLRVAVRFPQGQ